MKNAKSFLAPLAIVLLLAATACGLTWYLCCSGHGAADGVENSVAEATLADTISHCIPAMIMANEYLAFLFAMAVGLVVLMMLVDPLALDRLWTSGDGGFPEYGGSDWDGSNP